MQARHAVNALLSPHRTSIYHPDIAYRTRLSAYSARDTAFIYMKSLGTNGKRTNKGFTTYVSTRQHRLHAHSKPFPCNDICRNRSNGMPCILYLLTAKRLIVQVEHRYVGIGHCNRPGCIQRKMFRQAVHSLSHIVPACTHGITVTAVRQPELRQNQSRHGVHTMSVPENNTQSVSCRQSCGYRALLKAINNADGSIMHSLCKQFCNPA